MIDKSHAEQVERWANYINLTPQDVWREDLNKFINAQFEIAEKFYKKLGKTDEGRLILSRIKQAKIANSNV